MKVDKGQFDEVLRRMIGKPPQKTSEVRAVKKDKAARPSPKSARRKSGAETVPSGEPSL
jgi:hypothetical protein